MTTPAITMGPIRGPLPASSTPAISAMKTFLATAYLNLLMRPDEIMSLAIQKQSKKYININISKILMEKIQYKGVNDLSEQEKDTVEKLSSEYYEKIIRELQNLTSVELHVKTHDTDGKQKRFEIMAKVSAPTRIFEASYEDWDLARTLHKVFQKLENQIKKAFEKDAGLPKS
ncbi:hypothetical protein GF345_04025 [Candidatus Woesearchaeota archaeon]|nr:hypothetical protein [Candidatus Woesearchaeota archaeon]